jgi:hypothetical protein
MMTRRQILLAAMVVAFVPFSSGCVVEDRPGYGRAPETYYYYPDAEVYYYPRDQRYYWPDRGGWQFGPQPPRQYNIEGRPRVRLDLDYDPRTRHEQIKRDHPPGRYDQGRGEDRGRQDRDTDRQDRDR